MNIRQVCRKFGILILILAGGFLLRVWGINYGLPSNFHYDSGLAIYTAFSAASHKLEPDTFLYPLLLPDFLIILYGLYFVFGLVLHYWSSGLDFFASYLRDPSVFLLIGRLFIVAIDTVTIFMVYFIGKKVYRERVGLIAAFFLALTFLNVKESHYIEEDLILGLEAVIGFYFAYLISVSGKRKDYFLSAIIVGLAWSTKYNFFIFIPRLVLAHLIWLRKNFTGVFLSKFSRFFNSDFLLSIVTIVAVFLIFDPYTILKPKAALSGVLEEFQTATSLWVSTDGRPIWFYYLSHHLWYGMGWPLLLLSLISFFYLVFWSRRGKDFLLVLNPIIFFLTLFLFGSQNFARYAVMITPSLVLMAAILLDRLSDNLTQSKAKSRLFIFVACSLIILPSLNSILKFDYYASRPDARNLAKIWVESTVREGQKIVTEGATRSEYPSIFGVPLMMSEEKIADRFAQVRLLGQPGDYLLALSKARQGKKGFDLLGTMNLSFEYRQELNRYVEIPGVNNYIENGYCYLVTTDWAGGAVTPKKAKSFMDSLNNNYTLIKEFKPNPVLPAEPYEVLDYSKLGSVGLFDPTVIAGPGIKIYQLKDKQVCSTPPKAGLE